jgi:translation initiation factor IF-2
VIKKKKKISAKKGKLLSRPPVVAVLGHVDHGKTTLLDKIRKTNVVAKEAGGITQHIGAYQVAYKRRIITFIDTPGHAAFVKMRARGAEVTDLVVLVVAADEGVKPQTLESLKHIKATKTPYLVAINKIDLPNIIVDKVKKELAKNNILVEGFGGDIVAVPVSAKTGKGIDELLEMILLLAEMSELKADSHASLEAMVIESKLDRARGPVATILVKNGTLRLRDEIMADKLGAKVKAMLDETKKPVKEAGPGKPVEVLGFKGLPPVGSKIRKTKVVEEEVSKPKPTKKAIAKKGKSKKLRVILKADVAGTLEAVLTSLPEEVEVIFSGVGDVNDSDVLLASTTNSLLLGFNIKIPSQIRKLAQTEGVKIKTYRVIYELLEEVEKQALKVLEPTIDEEILGQAEIVAEFEAKKKRIAGCEVREGRIAKRDRLHLKRGAELVGNCRIKSMKQGKENVEKAKKEEEFGAVLAPSLDFRLGDMLVSFRKPKD